mgnify:FL=1
MTQREAKIIALKLLGQEWLPTADPYENENENDIEKVQRELEILGATLIERAEKLEKKQKKMPNEYISKN